MNSEPSPFELKKLAAEAESFRRGQKTASRVFEVVKLPDGRIERRRIDPESHRKQCARAWQAKTYTARVRHKLDLSQKAFAEHLGVAVSTVRKWEQEGGHPPKGAALKLLHLLEKRPELARELEGKA